MNTVAVLKLTLHHGVVGLFLRFQSGKNILVFTDLLSDLINNARH